MLKPVAGMYALLLALLLAVVGGLLLANEQTVPAIVLFALGCAALVWCGSRYQRIAVTVHRKWHSVEKSHSGATATANASGSRQAYHLATSHGDAIVTKSVYDRVAEGNAITVLGNVTNGNIHVIWPLV